jgi:hypothetical protein
MVGDIFKLAKVVANFFISSLLEATKNATSSALMEELLIVGVLPPMG